MRLIGIIPTKEELLSYLREHPHQTYTSLAKYFGIEMGTVRDLVKFHADDITIIPIGTALMVDIK